MVQRYHLSRFISAQECDYQTALSEIRNGRKESHWMWYIFPQIDGLGRSEMARYYAIADLEEAQDYLNDPYLGSHLREICQALLQLDTDNALAVFGSPDHMKLRSSMTLFSLAAEDPSLFDDVLLKFFGGKRDHRTLTILGL